MIAIIMLLIFFTTASGASAHHSTTSRVHNMRHIAENYYSPIYGPTVCDGRATMMSIPIVNADLPSGVIGRYVPDVCEIEIEDKHWETEDLCDLLAGHESGHAFGYRAPPGHEFSTSTSEIDDHHSNDPFDIMYPIVPMGFWEPCMHDAAST